MVISSTTSLFCGCHGAIPEWRGAGGIPHPQPPTSPGCRGGAKKIWCPIFPSSSRSLCTGKEGAGQIYVAHKGKYQSYVDKHLPVPDVYGEDKPGVPGDVFHAWQAQPPENWQVVSAKSKT